MLGLDLLGLGSEYWPIAKTIEVFPSQWALGCFDTTFGDHAVANARALLGTKKVAAFRVHLWWADSHVICPRSVVITQAPKWEALAKQFPDVKFYISHSCEYNEKNKATIEDRVKLIHQFAPSCTAVNCPMGGSPVAGNAITERHGDKAKGLPHDIVSTDGQSIYDMNASDWVTGQRGDITFLWGMRFNLKEVYHPGEKAPPPRKRKAIPSAEYMKGVIRSGNAIGMPPIPQFAGHFHLLKEPTIYKPFAEDSPGGDPPRENRPVLIVPSKSSQLEIVTVKGLSIGKLIRQGDPFNGMGRFYSGVPGGINLYGYQIGQKALALHGSEYVWFKDIQNNYFGSVNPAFRAGSFR